MGGGKRKATIYWALSEVRIMTSTLTVGKVKMGGTEKLAQAQAHKGEEFTPALTKSHLLHHLSNKLC